MNDQFNHCTSFATYIPTRAGSCCRCLHPLLPHTYLFRGSLD